MTLGGGPVRPEILPLPPSEGSIGGRIFAWLRNHFYWFKVTRLESHEQDILDKIDQLTNEDMAITYTSYGRGAIRTALANKAQKEGWNRVLALIGTPPKIDEKFKEQDYWIRLLTGVSEGDHPLYRVFQGIGAAVYNTIARAIVGPGKPLPEKTLPDIDRFIGVVTAMTSIPQVLSIIEEHVSLGQIDQVGRNIQNIYWNLGLGFLTWQALAPLLQNVILEPVDEEMKRMYRPRRFTDAQAGDLYALGQIDAGEFRELLRNTGWRDSDIEKVVGLQFTELSQGQLLDLWDAGILLDTDVSQRMRRLGYRASDIALLLRKHLLEQVGDSRSIYIGTLRKAFKAGRLSEAQFKDFATEMGLSTEAIQLEIDLINLERQEEGKDLTLTQIQKAYSEGLIDWQEAQFHLSKDGYDPRELQIIRGLWDREREPEFRKLSRASIVSAFIDGIIDEGQARQLLKELNYSPDSIGIVMSQAERERQLILIPPERLLTQSNIRLALLAGVIDSTIARRKLDDLDISPENQDIILETWQLEIEAMAEPPERQLNQSSIRSAFVNDVINEEQARTSLRTLDFSDPDINVLIADWTEQKVAPVPQISVSALQRALRNDLISHSEFDTKLAERGFDAPDRELFRRLALFEPPPEEKAPEAIRELPRELIVRAWKADLINRSNALVRLTRLGFIVDDADIILSLEEIETV